jgi:hypothetical protein
MWAKGRAGEQRGGVTRHAGDFMSDIWWSYWYFHIPNYVLALLIYTLFGRFLLGLVVPPDSRNYIFRWFVRWTDWVIVPVAIVTPRIVPPFVLPPIAAFWLIVVRIVFFIIMFGAGLTPRVAAG